jgi:hypothetical protein
VLAAAGTILSAQIAAKLLIVGSLFAAALFAYRSLPRGEFVPRAMASIVYLLNPFVYGRLHYGQIALVAGYAVLPWVATRLRHLCVKPGPRTALIAALALTLLGIFDLHLLFLAAVLMVTLLVAQLLLEERGPAYLIAIGRNLALTVGTATIASAYWVVPLVAGSGPQGRIIGPIGQSDVVAFQTNADPHLGLLPNVLGLYGFWAEGTHRFPSMKEFVPYWPVILVGLLLLAVLGAGALIRGNLVVAFGSSRAWGAGLLIAGLAAAVLAMGVAEEHIAPLIKWLDTILPLYRGMRDAGKWSALIALVYSQLVPAGAIVLFSWVKAHLPIGQFTEIAEAVSLGLMLALPLYYGNGVLFGMHGQVQPSEYPRGWYAVDRMLGGDAHPGRAIFLPWHEYLGLSFVRNEDAVIACPAPSFFSIGVVTSLDPQIRGIRPPDNPDQAAVTSLLRNGSDGDWAATLAARNIKYVLLAREVDWQSYTFINRQPQLVKLGDYDSIVLYLNLAWQG